MEREQAKFILRCSRPDKIETEGADFGAAQARAGGDQELRDWLVAEQARDITFAAALREVRVPASLRRELSICMEWTVRFGKPGNPVHAAWATLCRQFRSNKHLP